MTPLVEVLAAALRYVPTEAEREAASRPPYPLPEPLREHRARVAAELRALPPGPPAVTRILAAAQTVGALAPLVLGNDDVDFEDAACVLLAGGALGVADVRALAVALPTADLLGLRRQVVLTRLAGGDVDGALAAAADLGEWAFVGFRDVAAWHADRGDVGDFFALWPRLAAGRERNGINLLKSRLIQGVTRCSGWRAALEVTTDKRVGRAYAELAFAPMVEAGDVDGLLEVFGGDGVGVLAPLWELDVLVRAVSADSPRLPAADHPRVAELLERIAAIDPSVDRDTQRARDALLVGLWPALGDAATLAAVRKLVRAPAWRRELRVLPRDVAGR